VFDLGRKRGTIQTTQGMYKVPCNFSPTPSTPGALSGPLNPSRAVLLSPSPPQKKQSHPTSGSLSRKRKTRNPPQPPRSVIFVAAVASRLRLGSATARIRFPYPAGICPVVGYGTHVVSNWRAEGDQAEKWVNGHASNWPRMGPHMCPHMCFSHCD
jgi:hypothetical protein